MEETGNVEHKKDFKETFEEEERKKELENQEILNIDFGNVKDRLMARSKLLIVNVPMQDPQGDFSIKCRAFTVKEQNLVFDVLDEFRHLTLQKDNPKANPNKILARYNKGIETAKHLLAYPNGICLNPELNAEFWDGGQYTSDIPFYVMRYVMDHQSEAVRNAVLFRKAKRRDIPTSTLPDDET